VNDLGDAAAMAMGGVALVAEQADRRTGTHDRKELVERLLGAGGLQVFIVDAPERIEVTRAGGLPSVRGRSERAQVQDAMWLSSSDAASWRLEKPCRREAATARVSTTSETPARVSSRSTASDVARS
jgi:hypothetical protein